MRMTPDQVKSLIDRHYTDGWRLVVPVILVVAGIVSALASEFGIIDHGDAWTNWGFGLATGAGLCLAYLVGRNQVVAALVVDLRGTEDREA